MRFTFTLKDIKTSQISQALRDVVSDVQHITKLEPTEITGIARRIGQYRRALPSNLRSKGITLVIHKETE